MGTSVYITWHRGHYFADETNTVSVKKDDTSEDAYRDDYDLSLEEPQDQVENIAMREEHRKRERLKEKGPASNSHFAKHKPTPLTDFIKEDYVLAPDVKTLLEPGVQPEITEVLQPANRIAQLKQCYNLSEEDATKLFLNLQKGLQEELQGDHIAHNHKNMHKNEKLQEQKFLAKELVL